MKLAQFEVDSIGPMFRHMEPPFGRCEVRIGVRDEDSKSINVISLDLVTSYANDEPIGRLQAKILAETVRVLTAAVSLMDGKDVPTLHAAADADEKLQLGG